MSSGRKRVIITTGNQLHLNVCVKKTHFKNRIEKGGNSALKVDL